MAINASLDQRHVFINHVANSRLTMLGITSNKLISNNTRISNSTV